MHIALITHFKNLRRAIVLIVVLALCAPALVTLLPSPALSAEQLLLADLGQNICGHSQSDDKNQGGHTSNHECCVLCGASQFISAAQFAQAPDHLQIATVRFEPLLPTEPEPDFPPDNRSTAPRGPPSI